MQSISEFTTRTAVVMQNFLHDAAERMKDEEGQGVVEYAGILALLAVIFAAIFALKLDKTIGDKVGSAVGDILKGK